MREDRKKPGVAFWAIVVLVVVLLYVASIGPLYWEPINHHFSLGEFLQVASFYIPLVLLADNSVAAKSALKWYVGLWTDSLPIFLE